MSHISKFSYFFHISYLGHYFSTVPIFYVTFFDCLHIFRIFIPTRWKFTPQITVIFYHPFPNYRGWNFHQFSPPGKPVRGREVRFNRARIGICCKSFISKHTIILIFIIINYTHTPSNLHRK